MTKHDHDQLHVFVPLDPWWEEQIAANGWEVVSPVYKCVTCLGHLCQARFAAVGRKSLLVHNARKPPDDPEMILADFKVKWELPDDLDFSRGESC